MGKMRMKTRDMEVSATERKHAKYARRLTSLTSPPPQGHVSVHSPLHGPGAPLTGRSAGRRYKWSSCDGRPFSQAMARRAYDSSVPQNWRKISSSCSEAWIVMRLDTLHRHRERRERTGIKEDEQ